MSMMTPYFNDVVSRVRPTTDKWGEKVGESVTNIMARVEWGEKTIRDRAGMQVLVQAKVCVAYNTIMLAGDEIRIGGIGYTVMMSAKKNDFGNRYQELYIQ